MRAVLRLAPILLAGMLSAGCDINSNDPTAGGYLGGKMAVIHGTYHQQLQSLQQEYEDEQDAKLRTQRDLDNAKAQQQSLEKKLGDEQTQLAALDREVAALHQHTAEARQDNAISAADQAKLERQIQDLQLDVRTSELDSSDAAAKQATIAALEQRRQALEAALAAALKR